MRNVIFLLALVLMPLVAMGADSTVIHAKVDTTLLVLPSGDTLSVLMPTEVGPMPRLHGDEDVVQWFVNDFVSWWVVLIFLLVGYLSPFVPVLRDFSRKELSLLAFLLAAIVAIIFKDYVFGGTVSTLEVLRVVVSAALSTRIYAWVIMPSSIAGSKLWQLISSLFGKSAKDNVDSTS